MWFLPVLFLGLHKSATDEVANGVPVRKHEPPEVEEVYLDDDATVSFVRALMSFF